MIAQQSMAATPSNANSRLSASDTIVEADRAHYDEYQATIAEMGNWVYVTYHYNRLRVWLDVHSIATGQRVMRRSFRGNGRAMQYLIEAVGYSADSVTPDGPIAEFARRRSSLP
jgi:hypothetical protein